MQGREEAEMKSLPRSVALKELQPGDILLFRPPKKVGPIQKVIMLCQALVKQKQGHYDTTHTAICTGREDSEPTIAHISGGEHQGRGTYTNEKIGAYQKREQDRAFIIFRPQDPELADELVKIASNPEKRQLMWKLSTGMGLFFTRAKQDGKQSTVKHLSTDTVCSKFVIECLKIAIEKTAAEEPPIAIKSNSSPKTLESYLARHQDELNLQRLCYLGQDAFANLARAIEHQLYRVKSTQRGQNKARMGLATFYQALANLKSGPPLSEIEKSVYLLNQVLPILKINTGRGIRKAFSYRQIQNLARKMGVFNDYLQPKEEEAQPKVAESPKKAA